MPAGDLITGDYQWELAATLFGDTTTISVVKFTGMAPVVRAVATDRTLRDGAAVGTDTNATRSFEWELEIEDPGDPSGAMTAYVALMGAFDATASGLDELHMQLPGLGHVKIEGRPRGMTDDGLVDLWLGYVRCVARFDATEPTWTAVP